MSVRPSTEQLLVQVLMRSVEEVLGALAEHPADSPTVVQAARGLELSFAPIWSRLPFLDLQCVDAELRWQDDVVLDAEEDVHELVPTLTASGIHGLMLLPGVEREEMQRLAELVDRKRRLDEDGDQDLVLELFRADLRHVRYTVGPPVPRGAPRDESQGVAARQDAIGTSRPPFDAADAVEAADAADAAAVDDSPRTSADAAAIASSTESADSSGPDADFVVPAAPPPARSVAADFEIDVRTDAPEGAPDSEVAQGHRLSPAQVRALVVEDLASTPLADTVDDDFDSTHFLDEGEIAYLREAIDGEYHRDHARAVMALLLDTLETQSDPQIRDEVVGVLRDLLPYLLGTGRFPAVAYLTGELRKVTRTTKLEPRHKQALDQMRLAVSETDALTQLFHVLDDGSVEPTPDALGALLREMSQDAVQSVLVWIGQLRHPRAKAALVRSLEAYFLESPSSLEPMTTASDRAVVQRAVAIAGKLQNPDFAEPVAKALEHRDPGTRRLAVSALSTIGTPAALKLAARAVEDEDPEVRMTAFDAFTQRPFRGVARTLSTYLTTRDLEALDLSERRALFAAFATSNGPAGVPTLETVLLARGGLARRPSAQTRACAALALGMIDSPAARFALESATKEKDALVRSAAGAALRKEGVAS